MGGKLPEGVHGLAEICLCGREAVPWFRVVSKQGAENKTAPRRSGTRHLA
jgi:alkylated DNA nucleotide flippase Atl1